MESIGITSCPDGWVIYARRDDDLICINKKGYTHVSKNSLKQCKILLRVVDIQFPGDDKPNYIPCYIDLNDNFNGLYGKVKLINGYYIIYDDVSVYITQDTKNIFKSKEMKGEQINLFKSLCKLNIDKIDIQPHECVIHTKDGKSHNLYSYEKKLTI